MLNLSERFGEWKPVSRLTGISWLVVYVLFLLYAALNAPNFLFVDFANLAIVRLVSSQPHELQHSE